MGFGGLGMWEILLIFLVVLLLFGAKRLPEIGSSLGKGIREFKGSLREIEKEVNPPEERDASRRLPDRGPGAAADHGPRSRETEGEPRKLSNS